MTRFRYKLTLLNLVSLRRDESLFRYLRIGLRILRVISDSEQIVSFIFTRLIIQIFRIFGPNYVISSLHPFQQKIFFMLKVVRVTSLIWLRQTDFGKIVKRLKRFWYKNWGNLYTYLDFNLVFACLRGQWCPSCCC